jgi:SAM-dependent MidA family methyltransferase
LKNASILAINSVGYRETKQSDAFLQAMKMPKSAISEEILKLGTISFARFMELALYCPETGYYETEKNKIGRGGDFITSVSVGNLFGELLAFQFSEWLEELRIQNLKLKTQNSKLRIVEAGAHDGKLAADILNWLEKNRPQLFSQIDYCILEPSARRQEWQKQMLKKFAGKVFWFADFENLKPETQKLKPSGIIFSNELLDAFPIPGKNLVRMGRDDGKRKIYLEKNLRFKNQNSKPGIKSVARTFSGFAKRLPY